MRPLTYYVGTSIDGFIAAPDGSIDIYPVGPDLAEHLVERYADAFPGHVRRAIGVDPPLTRFDTVVMGRATYEPALREGITSPYPHLRQYVVSRTMTSPDPAVEVVATEPVERVRRLKEEDGAGIYLAGGGRLAGALLPEIDELVVKLYPIVIGTGVPMFGTGFGVQRFDLVETHAFASGALVLTYQARRSRPGTVAED